MSTPLHGLYTNASSGGVYELLGPSAGAGTLRGAPEEMIYLDTASGRVFRRLPDDFAEWMKPMTASAEHERMCRVPYSLLEKWLAVERGDYDVFPPEVAAETRALMEPLTS